MLSLRPDAQCSVLMVRILLHDGAQSLWPYYCIKIGIFVLKAFAIYGGMLVWVSP